MKWSYLKVQTEYCKQQPLFHNTIKQHKATFQKKQNSVSKNESSFTKQFAAAIQITIDYPQQTNETLGWAPRKKRLEGKSARKDRLWMCLEPGKSVRQSNS